MERGCGQRGSYLSRASGASRGPGRDGGRRRTAIYNHVEDNMGRSNGEKGLKRS